MPTYPAVTKPTATGSKYKCGGVSPRTTPSAANAATASAGHWRMPKTSRKASARPAVGFQVVIANGRIAYKYVAQSRHTYATTNAAAMASRRRTCGADADVNCVSGLSCESSMGTAKYRPPDARLEGTSMRENTYVRPP